MNLIERTGTFSLKVLKIYSALFSKCNKVFDEIMIFFMYFLKKLPEKL